MTEDARQPLQPVTGLPPRAAADHAALALFPFSLALAEPSKHSGAMTFAYELAIGNRQHRMRITLTPGDSGELPVLSDQMVYLALLQLALRQPIPEPVLLFQRSEVFDLLQWPAKGRRHQRLKDALRRLWDLGIVIETELPSRHGQAYEKRIEMTRLINRVQLSTRQDTRCEVEWGDIVRQAFLLRDFKRLDWDLLISLGTPLTAQLYRLLDRVCLAGETSWSVHWTDLAGALGINSSSYSRPARFRQVLEPHYEALIGHGVVQGVDYQRGGLFTFQINNYLRRKLHRVLVDFGVFDRAASRLLASHDETAIMLQCDCLDNGHRPPPQNRAAYLVKAVEEQYELRYPDYESMTFAGLWGSLSAYEQDLYHRAGLKLLGAESDLFEASSDPTVWSQTLRALLRFMLAHIVDPSQVLGLQAPPLPPPPLS